MQEITPIIVIGMNRTGTKWLSNTLCKHENVIGAQSERGRGILETNMFGAMQDKFDLSFPDEYVGFLEMWSMTELFRQTKVDKEMFYKLQPRPREMLQLFDLLMCEFARKNNKTFWLQKTSPLRAAEVLNYFDRARVVITRRNILDTLKSTWAMKARHGSRRILRTTYAFVRDRKSLDRLAKRYKIVEVHYEVFRAQTESEVTRLCLALGLDPEKMLSRTSFRRNTSFENERERENIMSNRERLLVKVAAACFKLIPLPLMTVASTIKTRLWGRKRIPLMSGTFGELFDQLEDRLKYN
ncbi:MAG: sulfotransferase [Woeseiaceae bacterium]